MPKIAARKGARVWFRFCPVNGGQWEKPEEREKLLKEQAQYYEELQELLDIPIIGDPADAVMDAEWFYDTNFHLNKSGKIVNTRQAAEDIKAMLGDSSPTEIALPSKPSVEDTVREDGAGETKNDSADDFQWKAEDGTAVLTGLTEKGREQETISVPDRIEGLPVEILPAEIFAGNRRVRRIEVSSGIRLIEDNAFAGCTSLKEIVMESADPEDCMVGQKLLEGTDADILVPEEALTDYRLNYSWSSYGSRIVKSR